MLPSRRMVRNTPSHDPSVHWEQSCPTLIPDWMIGVMSPHATVSPLTVTVAAVKLLGGLI